MQGKVKECAVETRYALPEEVWRQFCDNYWITTDLKKKPVTPVRLDYSQDSFKTLLTMPKYERPIAEEYVAVLPVFSEFYRSCGYRATCSLKTRHWQQIKEAVNKLGYKVAILGLEPDMGMYSKKHKKQHYIGDDKAYADYIFYKSKSDHPFGIIAEQLPYIANAKLTIAAGGASAIPLIFGANSILLDNHFGTQPRIIDGVRYDHYTIICRRVASYNPQLRCMPFRKDISNRMAKEDIERAYDWTANFVLDNLAASLNYSPYCW